MCLSPPCLSDMKRQICKMQTCCVLDHFREVDGNFMRFQGTSLLMMAEYPANCINIY